MIYEVAKVEDKGSYWFITGVTESSFLSDDQIGKYLRLSSVSTKLIKDALLNGEEVRVYKPLTADEVLPREVKILKVAEDDIEAFKQNQLKRVRMVFNSNLATYSGLTYFNFLGLNNELADMGYLITDENRESKYLALLESGNEMNISKLEDYLNSRDEISRVSSLYKKYEEFCKKIKAETDMSAIEKMANNFIDDFYSRF